MNIYCTKKLAKTLNLVDVESVEISREYWLANIFKTGNVDWVLFTDVTTLYSVLIQANAEMQDNISREFILAFKAQLKSDSLWLNKMNTNFENAMKTINFYAGLEKGTQNISNNIIRRLKEIFDDTQNLNSIRRYADKHMNDIPWKVIKFNNAKELMSLDIKNYR